jgi:hypothetical protein
MVFIHVLRIAIVLSTMNISAATLFPGLDGYARSQKIHVRSSQFTFRQRRNLHGRYMRALFRRIHKKKGGGGTLLDDQTG